MTRPEGTVVLVWVVTVPRIRPASVIAVVAAACVRPTTFGTATCVGGVLGAAARISIAARFHWFVADGAVSLIVTVAPPVTGVERACTQNVSFARVSTHWWTIVWPEPKVRAMAPFQSLPTP